MCNSTNVGVGGSLDSKIQVCTFFQWAVSNLTIKWPFVNYKLLTYKLHISIAWFICIILIYSFFHRDTRRWHDVTRMCRYHRVRSPDYFYSFAAWNSPLIESIPTAG